MDSLRRDSIYKHVLSLLVLLLCNVGLGECLILQAKAAAAHHDGSGSELLLHDSRWRRPGLSASIITPRAPSPTPAPLLSSSSSSWLRGNGTQIQRRDMVTELSTCGYLNGDPTNFRTANDGFNCRVDTKNGLWGFCPTTVIAATDCGLAGSCVDRHSCSKGCGLTNVHSLTTFTCEAKGYCSLALLTFGVDQTYSYVACGGAATTDHYLISPTAAASPTSSTSSTSSSSSSSSSEATSSAERRTTSSTPSATSNPPPTPTPTNPSSASASSKPNNIGPIIGGGIGGIALVCGSAIAIIYLLRKNRDATPSADKNAGKRDDAAAENRQPLDGSAAQMQEEYYGYREYGQTHELNAAYSPRVYEMPTLPGNTRYAELSS